MNVVELQAKAAGLKVRIRELTAERERLAPLAINGAVEGPQARSRIAAIDAERQRHVSDLETTEAAARAAFRAEREAKAREVTIARRRRFDRDKAALGRVLVETISARYGRLAYDIDVAVRARRYDEARSMIDGTQLAHVTAGVSAANPPRTPLIDIPMATARELCGLPKYMGSFDVLMQVPNWEYVEGERGEPGQRVHYTLFEQEAMRQQRRAEFDAQVNVLANGLLASITVPPWPPELQSRVAALYADGHD